MEQGQVVILGSLEEDVKQKWADYLAYDNVATGFLRKLSEHLIGEVKGSSLISRFVPFAANRQERVLEVCTEVLIEAFAMSEKKRLAFWELVYTKYDKSKYGSLKYDPEKNELRGVPVATPQAKEQ